MEMHKLRYLKEFFDQTGKNQERLQNIIKSNKIKICHY
jgi:hypothetical protein